MCGRFLVTSPGQRIAEFFDLPEVPEWTPRYNIAPSQEVGTVVGLPEKERDFAVRRWGLIPAWAKESSIGNRLINARSETAAEKPAFRNAFAKRRCLVPVDGFYEWSPRSRGHTPYCFRHRDGEMLAIAALWESWTAPGGGEVESFALLTTEANAVVRRVHGRMPALLARDQFDTWLDPENDRVPVLKRLLVPSATPWLKAQPVGSFVNDPRHDGTRCLEALRPDQAGLF